jgi:large subunit ribosomal protein L10
MSNLEVTTVALSFAQKEAIVAEVAEVAKGAYSLVGAEYRGLSVDELTDLRVRARNAGVYVRVVKNTLAKRAFEDSDFSCTTNELKGPLLFAFSQEDPGAAARVAEAFAKGHDQFKVKLLSIGGKLLDASELSTLAKMLIYDEAISQLMAVLKAPVQKLAATMNEVPGKLVRTLAAVRDARDAA